MQDKFIYFTMCKGIYTSWTYYIMQFCFMLKICRVNLPWYLQCPLWKQLRYENFLTWIPESLSQRQMSKNASNGDFHQTVCVTSLCKESPVACIYEESNKFSLQNGVLYRNIVLNKQNVRQLVLTVSFRLITFRDINFDTPMQAIMEGTVLYIRWER